jgi:ABC-2 type transport system ATP-binding protein
VLTIIRNLVRDRGVGVLWATHLVDEVAADDHVVLLHKGRVRFAGPAPKLLEAAQASTLRSAFMRLTEPALAGAA